MSAFVRRTVTALVGTVLAVVLAAPAHAGYEVWALDQGTNTLYVLSSELEVVETVAFPDDVDMPHMIDFTADHAYAFVANPASGNTAVVRAADREVVAVLPTGAGSHYAGVVPGDERVIVAVIGEAKLVEIEIGREREAFTLGRELVLADDPLIAARRAEFPGTSPVCHTYDPAGRFAFVTLGPGLAEAGLVVLDVGTFTLARVFAPDEVRVNCGAVATRDGRHVLLTGGSVDVGVWYVLDAETLEVVHQDSSRGTDAHGVYPVHAGDAIWLVNRHSSDGIVIDPETFAVTAEIPFTGRSPDILAISPDDRFAFVTLRGPEPRSGPHAIHGDTPGVAVLDVATRELVKVIAPDRDNPMSDFHGIGVRPLAP
jgi:DNA-binding beta-propeller fold protein YncE